MRKITVITFLTLDGVMQAPGGPEEDTEAKFAFGGWQAPYEDPLFNEVITKVLAEPVEYLLGRKTFDIWEAYWPNHGEMWPGINSGMKYIYSNTRTDTTWQNTMFIQAIDDIQKLKNSDGPNLQVWGSSKLVQLLMEHDLVDQFTLMTYPLVLGQGKKLFGNGAAPAALELTSCQSGNSGVIIATYQRAGEVKTGNMGA